MGAGTIIATAIAITLLIITGYVLIAGTLSTAQVVAMAQQAAAEQEAQRIHTRIEIMNASTNTTTQQTFIEVKNTGSEVVGDFDHMEVYLLQGGVPYTYTNLSVPMELDLHHQPRNWFIPICSILTRSRISRSSMIQA